MQRHAGRHMTFQTDITTNPSGATRLVGRTATFHPDAVIERVLHSIEATLAGKPDPFPLSEKMRRKWFGWAAPKTRINAGRLIRAAKKAGLAVERVESDQDGKVSVIIAKPGAASSVSDLNPWDEVLINDADKKFS
jgi:hypothetical protein